MKGIITQYFEDKAYGFIEDENKENRFFHLKNMREKSIFLTNLNYYLYTEKAEWKCFVVTFNPSQSEKGLEAIDITLTNQILNDRTIKSEFEGKILNIECDAFSSARIVSGIKKAMPVPISATAGSNGTYRTGYPEVLKEVNLYFRKTNDIGWGTIDIRELVLTINNRRKITGKLIKTLENQLIGKITTIYPNNGRWTLKDPSILKV